MNNYLERIDTQRMFESIEQNRRETFGHADVIYKRLLAQIRDFEAALAVNEEIGAYLASFGRELLVRIETLAFSNPYLIVFAGIVEATGSRVQLVQHTTQLNVLFAALPKKGNNLLGIMRGLTLRSSRLAAVRWPGASAPCASQL